MSDLQTKLNTHFHFDDFRPGQSEAIQYLLQKKNTLVVMPTGFGKSLCYQLPAVLSTHTTVVVSPLIALMKDQVEALHAHGIAATFINSSLTASEQTARLQKMRQGDYRLVYVAPERFRSRTFFTALSMVQVDLFAIDEAHCISHWGHDFRPDYLTLRQVIDRIGRPTVVALTATATVQVQEDIIRQLDLKSCEKIITGFNRPNLSFEVEYTADDTAKFTLLEELLKGKSQSAIVYTGTRKAAEEVGYFLRVSCKRKTDFYHGGLNTADRSRIQDAFMSDATSVIVATNAFGMGVDKPDIRFVIHFNVPGTLEAYYQEAGRAGRDGEPARALLLYAPQDQGLQEWFIDNDAPELDELKDMYELLKQRAEDGLIRVSLSYLKEKMDLYETKIRVGLSELVRAGALRDLGDEYGKMHFKFFSRVKPDYSAILDKIEERRRYRYRQLKQMIRYAEGNSCRRRFILKHFGDTGSAEAERCCDNCLSRHVEKPQKPPAGREYSEAEKTALIILHTVKHLRRSVGRSKLAAILTGSKAQAIFDYGWNKVKNYGRLQHFTSTQCLYYIDQLLKQRYFKLIGSDYPVLSLTPRGKDALSRLACIPLKLDLSRKQTQNGYLPTTLGRTLELFRKGNTIEEIAEMRNLTTGTVYEHISELVSKGLVNVSAVVPAERLKTISDVIHRLGFTAYRMIKDQLPKDFTYDEIRCVWQSEARKQRTGIESE
ncbi:MAG: RecQ family ATP-dependent DNA helicase [bacterium]